MSVWKLPYLATQEWRPHPDVLICFTGVQNGLASVSGVSVRTTVSSKFRIFLVSAILCFLLRHTVYAFFWPFLHSHSVNVFKDPRCGKGTISGVRRHVGTKERLLRSLLRSNSSQARWCTTTEYSVAGREEERMQWRASKEIPEKAS